MPRTAYNSLVRKFAAIGLVLGVGLVLTGCETEPPPDPNDPAEVGILQPIVMQRQLKWASDAANARVASGEWTESFAKQRVSEYAEQLIEKTPIEKIPAGKAWEYADIFRTAQRWKEAVPLFEKAITEAKTEDRRVNDTLRLAHCFAALGRVEEAITTARKAFTAPNHETAPLLPAIYLEIVPAGRGKGKDKKLAQLIKDCLPIWQATVVDPSKDSGKQFAMARNHHISQALKLAGDLERGKP
jgi:tetratricopeptide (TPR) repeat protein